MKRSEMLDKLQDVLINLGLKTEYDCGCCQKEASIDEAEAILHFIEYAAMMPPKDIQKSFRILPNGEMTYNVYRWEPENE